MSKNRLTEHWFVGINDKTLAEFVIVLHGKSKRLDDFKAKLKENGADFPDSFVENLDRLILALHPKYKKKSKANAKSKKNSDDSTAKDHRIRMFPGLALPNQEWKPSPLGEEHERAIDKDATEKEVNGLISQLEGFAKKSRPRAADMMDIEDGPTTKRRRIDSSPPRRSPQRDLNGPSDHNRGRDGWDRERRKQQLDERPVLYKIYDGKVSGLRDFGAFVTLDAIRGRVEGTSLLEGFTTRI